MNRVPHCDGYEYIDEVNYMYLSFYCKHDLLEQPLQICVDRLPLTSPMWCPLRKVRCEIIPLSPTLSKLHKPNLAPSIYYTYLPLFILVK